MNTFTQQSVKQTGFPCCMLKWFLPFASYTSMVSRFSCVQLWDPMNCSPPGSSVHGILQARILEWVAIFFSRGFSWPKDQTHVLSPALAGGFFTTSTTWEAPHTLVVALYVAGRSDSWRGELLLLSLCWGCWYHHRDLPKHSSPCPESNSDTFHKDDHQLGKVVHWRQENIGLTKFFRAFL